MPRPDPSAKSQNIYTDFTEDGLPCAEIKEHTRGKLQMLGYYLEIVAKAMSEKYANLYYIDLYAGSGRGRMKRTGEILEGSPLIACRTVPRFTKLIFCEERANLAAVLRTRIDREFSFLATRVIPRSCSDAIDEVLRELPPSLHGFLAVCFVDPFNLGIRLKTIRKLAHLKIDFVTLLADRMAGLRNVGQLTAPGNDVVENLLDDPHWREHWAVALGDGERFDRFVLREFTEAMGRMGFKSGTPDRVNVTNKNVGLYRLVLFSKDSLALEFWDSTAKRARNQLKLL
jgi:three-Cys-motif partner protein